MNFLKISFMRDLLALFDALCKKYGIDGSQEMTDPENSDQTEELARLRGIFSTKVAGILVETTSEPSEPSEPEEPVAIQYKVTDDETPQQGKTYYTRSGESEPYTYTEFDGVAFEQDVTYYEVDDGNQGGTETPTEPSDPAPTEPEETPTVTYIATEDETPQAGKTYYTRSGEEGSYEYTEFTGDTFDAQTTYYVVEETPETPVVPEVTYVETQDETPQPETTYYTRSGEEGSYEYTEFTGESFDSQTTYYVVDNSGSTV